MQATSINNKGWISGCCSNDSGARAVVWIDNTIYDLNQFLPADSGWVLEYARGVNDQGQIVGTGLYNGKYETFVLTLTPEPSSILALVCGAGVIGGMLRKRR
jgi:uncharacterized membrane protein